MSGLQQALEHLREAPRQLVLKQVEIWSGGSDGHWQRVAENLKLETALSLEDFRGLLEDFANELEKDSSTAAWISACRKSQHKGRCMDTLMAPEVVGRALSLDHYAAFVQQGTPGLTESQAKELVRTVIFAGAAPSPSQKRILSRAYVGRYVVWATFNIARPQEHPFAALERSILCIRTAFGLGHCSDTDTLLLVAYRARSENVELRRPTVADAGSYSWYRPCTGADEPHGWTEPLTPNPGGWERQPELVHRELRGSALVFPVYSTG